MNDSGQLGNGAAGGATAAAPVTNPGGVTPVLWAQLAAYYGSACGLSTTGTAYCWGDPALVGAGAPPPATAYVPVPVVAAPGQSWAWARLSTGCRAPTTLAVAGAGGGASVYGWGARRTRAGPGTARNRPRATPSRRPPRPAPPPARRLRRRVPARQRLHQRRGVRQGARARARGRAALHRRCVRGRGAVHDVRPDDGRVRHEQGERRRVQRRDLLLRRVQRLGPGRRARVARARGGVEATAAALRRAGAARA
jgi:hypothetical protein